MPELAEVEWFRKQWNPGLGAEVVDLSLHTRNRVFRGENLRELQQLAVGAGINGVMMGNFLTTLGNEPELDRAMFEELGLNVARQPDNASNPRPDNRSGWLSGETPDVIEEVLDRAPAPEVSMKPIGGKAKRRKLIRASSTKNVSSNSWIDIGKRRSRQRCSCKMVFRGSGIGWPTKFFGARKCCHQNEFGN